MSAHQIGREDFDALKLHLKKLGFTFEKRQYQAFLARYDKFTVNLYESGKITFGGKDKTLQQEVEWFIKDKLASKSEEKEPSPGFEGILRIGTDEVGKGDFFGPLIVAGVLIDPDIEGELQRIGVRDSKKISNEGRIVELARIIKSKVGRDCFEIVQINPIRYNSLYEKLGNINLILGWAHARAIENILERNPGCKTAIADQFGDPSYIQKSLMAKGGSIRLVQITKGERDIAVASASILARDRFLTSMRKMCSEFDTDFPFGSRDVEDTAKTFVKKFGYDSLGKVAKVHFSTARSFANR